MELVALSVPPASVPAVILATGSFFCADLGGGIADDGGNHARAVRRQMNFVSRAMTGLIAGGSESIVIAQDAKKHGGHDRYALACRNQAGDASSVQYILISIQSACMTRKACKK